MTKKQTILVNSRRRTIFVLFFRPVVKVLHRVQNHFLAMQRFFYLYFNCFCFVILWIVLSCHYVCFGFVDSLIAGGSMKCFKCHVYHIHPVLWQMAYIKIVSYIQYNFEENKIHFFPLLMRFILHHHTFKISKNSSFDFVSMREK